MRPTWDVVPRHELGRDAWDRFVANCDQAWLWHRFDVAAASPTDSSFALVGRDGEPAMVIPLHLVKDRVRWMRVSSLYSPGGPVPLKGPSDVVNALRRQLTSVAAARRVVGINLSFSPMARAFRSGEDSGNPLSVLGGAVHTGQSWVIDLRDGIDRVWEGMQQRTRRRVRKAERLGVTVRPASPDDLDVYYGLHVETYRRTGARPEPREYFAAILEQCIPAGLTHAFIAELDGVPIAAHTFGVLDDAACYWTGASNETGLECGANHLVHWTAIRSLVSNDIAWYLTGEAFDATEGKLWGLNEFYRSFGGALHPRFWSWLDTAGPVHSTLRRVRALTRSWRSAQ
jgi:lipid II:glycine glycyltransferase (peptidoglycan interpeptide bridge formation enzyme)